MMNAQQLQLIRNAILLQLEQVSPLALTEGFLRNGVNVQGFTATEAELSKQTKYLEGKGFIEQKRGEISAGLVKWHLTAQGLEYLEREGLLG